MSIDTIGFALGACAGLFCLARETRRPARVVWIALSVICLALLLASLA